MGYAKKQMEGEYLNWYNIIGANKGNDPKLSEYSPISGNFGSLDWEGHNKEAVKATVKGIDETCQSIYNDLSKNIEKVKYCKGPIYESLSTLKEKYDEYNEYIDEYERALAELEKQKKLEAANKNNKEVS